MLVIRDIMYCKPGKARPMVQKFLALSKAGTTLGFRAMRVMTDLSAERYWTVVAELEVPTLQEYETMMKTGMEQKEFQDIMKDYHELIEHGRREIYSLEG